LFMYQFLFPV